MIGKMAISKSLLLFYISIFIFITSQILLSEDNKKADNCIDQAVNRIIAIRTLPERKYLYTLDGQEVLLDEFYAKCLRLFPQCCLFRRFYYWKSEVREVVSNIKNCSIKHKIRCYNNCLSTFCPESCNPRKTHGDVAEFYDQTGRFMGLSVYMGDGKYCSLPYDGYKNESSQ